MKVPFGVSFRDTKRTLYSIADPFLRFWLKFVEPNHSLIEASLDGSIESAVLKQWPDYVAGAWELLCRQSVPRLFIQGRRWMPASRWWGKTVDGANMELDIVSSGIDDANHILVGEAKHACSVKDLSRLFSDLQSKSLRCPALQGKQLTYALWIMKGDGKKKDIFSAEDVVEALK